MVQTIENILRNSLLKHANKVIYFCDAGNISGNVAVHEIRKSFKRLRAWLLLCGDMYTQKIAELKELGKQLAPIRESYVNLITFEKHFTNKQLLPDRKVKLMLEILSAENREKLLLLTGENNLLNSIRNSVTEFDKEITALKENNLYNKQIESQLQISYLLSYNSFLSVLENSDSRNLHKLRIKMKKLWYQFELMKFLNPKYFATKSRQLNDITESLGTDHDNFIMWRHIHENHAACFEKEELTVFDNLIGHQHELALSGIMPKLKQIFTEEPEEFNKRLEGYIKESIN